MPAHPTAHFVVPQPDFPFARLQHLFNPVPPAMRSYWPWPAAPPSSKQRRAGIRESAGRPSRSARTRVVTVYGPSKEEAKQLKAGKDPYQPKKKVGPWV